MPPGNVKLAELTVLPNLVILRLLVPDWIDITFRYFGISSVLPVLPTSVLVDTFNRLSIMPFQESSRQAVPERVNYGQLLPVWPKNRT